MFCQVSSKKAETSGNEYHDILLLKAVSRVLVRAAAAIVAQPTQETRRNVWKAKTDFLDILIPPR